MSEQVMEKVERVRIGDYVYVLAEDHEEALEEAHRERDQAIAHDRQPYPTAWAYEQTCRVEREQRARADQAEAERDEAWKERDWAVYTTGRESRAAWAERRRAVQAEQERDQARKSERSKVEAALEQVAAWCDKQAELEGIEAAMSAPPDKRRPWAEAIITYRKVADHIRVALKASTDSEGAVLASHPNRDDESARLAAFQALTEGDFFNFTDPEHQSEDVWRYVDAVLDAYLAALKVSTEEEGEVAPGQKKRPAQVWRDATADEIEAGDKLSLYCQVSGSEMDWKGADVVAKTDEEIVVRYWDGEEIHLRHSAFEYGSRKLITQPQQEEQTSPKEER